MPSSLRLDHPATIFSTRRHAREKILTTHGYPSIGSRPST
jgi:hypothetical protein